MAYFNLKLVNDMQLLLATTCQAVQALIYLANINLLSDSLQVATPHYKLLKI